MLLILPLATPKVSLAAFIFPAGHALTAAVKDRLAVVCVKFSKFGGGPVKPSPRSRLALGVIEAAGHSAIWAT